MAKKSVNKSALVRDYLAKYPEKGPTAIAQQVNDEHGVKVTGKFVATIKTKLKQASGSAATASAAAAPTPAPSASTPAKKKPAPPTVKPTPTKTTSAPANAADAAHDSRERYSSLAGSDFRADGAGATAGDAGRVSAGLTSLDSFLLGR